MIFVPRILECAGYTHALSTHASSGTCALMYPHKTVDSHKTTLRSTCNTTTHKL